jgi:hypothetical protein
MKSIKDKYKKYTNLLIVDQPDINTPELCTGW